MTKESLCSLRHLRDHGYIQGFLMSRFGCIVVLDNESISADDERLERMMAQTQIWKLLGLTDTKRTRRRSPSA
jgi:hypothetical protein